MAIEKVVSVFLVIVVVLSDGHPTYRRASPLQYGERGQRCPDNKMSCESQQTCCEIDGKTGTYGCCPVKDAVCCANGCCSNGSTCNNQNGACVKNSDKAVLLQSQFILNVVCPDGESECPRGNTCCKLSSSRYGCCPEANAVCCSDDKHCCPSDTTCDLRSGTCSNGISTVAMLKKQPALTRLASPNVVCPDGGECSSGQTCCQVGANQYGCCPKPNAVCCNDDKHCCPSGTTCDVSGGTCSNGISTVPMLKKQPALTRLTSPNVVCPDGGECSSGQTCCQVGANQYGCCPKPNAVCCNDDKHCCPSGTTCDVSGGTCSNGISTVPMLKKQPALTRLTSLGNVICPSKKVSCDDNSVCCPLSGNKLGYGCCPHVNGNCCGTTLNYCCPQGQQCINRDKGGCKGSVDEDTLPATWFDHVENGQL